MSAAVHKYYYTLPLLSTNPNDIADTLQICFVFLVLTAGEKFGMETRNIAWLLCLLFCECLWNPPRGFILFFSITFTYLITVKCVAMFIYNNTQRIQLREPCTLHIYLTLCVRQKFTLCFSLTEKLAKI